MNRSPKRVTVTPDQSLDETPVGGLINFGPVTAPELEAIGLATLGDLRKLGWQEVCRRWASEFPERLNANAFIAVLATLEGLVWTKVTPSHRAEVKVFVKRLKAEFKV